MNEQAIQSAYSLARDRYAELGVDTESALTALTDIPISIHCWQGDDVGGFEGSGQLDGGLAATGNYPGKARSAEELRADFAKAHSLIPGSHRINLHAIYAETAGKAVDRDELAPEHFAAWIDWAKQLGLGMDFNPTFFSHPKAADGLTLSHRDKTIRQFWIAHARACRTIGAAMGQALGSDTVTNIWIPDGYKAPPADRAAPRQRLIESLDAILTEPLEGNLDAVESKLFGIGSESYVVGSSEFYLGYAAAHQILLCLDAGHFHPTEVISDKISAVMPWVPGLLLHVSRGVRWDSDHVVILTDELRAIAAELVRGGYLSRTHIGLDYFDASINRVAAWVIGSRNMAKALLEALLEPTDRLVAAEADGDFTTRLALMEDCKTLPAGAVWDEYCHRHDVPCDTAWLAEVKQYEADVLSTRG